MASPAIMLPRTTLNLITSPQTLGLEPNRALIVGQSSGGARAAGSVTFAANPSASATVTIGGTAWTFVASGATGSQTNIGADLAATLTALATALNASADTNIKKGTYVATATALLVFARAPGVAGNAITLAASAATVSGATLSGGAAASNMAPAGAVTSVTDYGHKAAHANDLVGANSHLGSVVRGWLAVNEITKLDVLPLADSATGIPATAAIAFAGTATKAGTLKVTVASETNHTYQIDVNVGDTPDDIVSVLLAGIAADRWMPFSAVGDAATTVAFCANNAGLVANDWVIACAGTVPGITVTLTGWAGGATNPSLTGLFSAVGSTRYQTIVYPGCYTLATLGTFLDGRKNVENDILEGRGFVYRNVALATAKADTLNLNSSEVVVFNNVPTSVANRWVGPHFPEMPEVIAATFAAARARRFETDRSVSDIVATNAARDQFGGIHMASLPYFNTPLLNIGRPLLGTGYDETSQRDAEAGGVAVLGVNDSYTRSITGMVTTTWQFDTAGNPDTTWKWLEFRDTHGVVREYIVNNVRKRFQQTRLTTGDIDPDYDMANAATIQAYVLGLTQDLQRQTLIVDGQESRQFITDNLKVTLQPAQRQATVNLVYWQVSQLGSVIGTIGFTFKSNQ